MLNRIVAIAGMCGSGKSVATEYLEQKGWKKVYFGGVIYDKMREANIEITPESQKEFRENLRKQYGMSVVAQLLFPTIKELSLEHDVVLDGLYSWDELTFLKKELGEQLTVIAIISDKHLRYERLAHSEERPFTNEEAKERDLAEIENSAKAGPIAYADYFIINNGTITSYLEQLEAILTKI